MADRDDDEPGTYGLADSKPAKPRYIPQKGFKASSEREPDPFDEPVLKRFVGNDPFPWVLCLCVLVWVGLGLMGRYYPVCKVALIFAGFAVVLLGQAWMYLSIFSDKG